MSMILGWLFLFEDEWKELVKHVFAGSAFASNIELMREGGYFGARVNPLLHLWSLGIEEQFYVV
jgi:peptidoglycan/LPS O-acetylase OafA/YrhL